MVLTPYEVLNICNNFQLSKFYVLKLKVHIEMQINKMVKLLNKRTCIYKQFHLNLV